MTTTITGATGVNQITDDAITAAKLPAGSVLQVVHVKGSGTDTTTTSTSYVASGLQASITPQFSNSKIMVIFNSISFVNGAGGHYGVSVSIHRGGSETSPTMRGGVRKDNSGGSWISASYTIAGLDSPNTTNAVVYEPYFKSYANTAYFFVDHVQSNPTITLMEIAG